MNGRKARCGNHEAGIASMHDSPIVWYVHRAHMALVIYTHPRTMLYSRVSMHYTPHPLYSRAQERGSALPHSVLSWTVPVCPLMPCIRNRYIRSEGYGHSHEWCAGGYTPSTLSLPLPRNNHTNDVTVPYFSSSLPLSSLHFSSWVQHVTSPFANHSRCIILRVNVLSSLDLLIKWVEILLPILFPIISRLAVVLSHGIIKNI